MANPIFVRQRVRKSFHGWRVTQVRPRAFTESGVVDSQVFASLFFDRFQWIGTGLPIQSSPIIPDLLRLSVSNISSSIYPTRSTIFAACGGSLPPQTALNFTQDLRHSAPGRSSLHLGHGGVVLGQDLHQFVPPVKRVAEPAQLSRDLHGGRDFCGKTDYVTQVGSHAQIFKQLGLNSSRPCRTLTFLRHFSTEE